MQKRQVLLLHKHRVFYLWGRSILAAFHPLQVPQRRIEIHIFQQVIRRVDKVTGRPDLPVAMPRVAAPISFRLQVGNHSFFEQQIVEESRKPAITMEPLNLKTFGQRLRALRLEAEQTQDEFAARIGLSKQILSRLEKGQQMPKLDQVQDYAEKLGVPVECLFGEDPQEAVIDALATKKRKPFYKIFIDVTEQLGLDIPGIVRVTGLTDRQVRLIITRRVKEAPLGLALQLSETLNAPLSTWTGEHEYQPQELSLEAYEAARAYDRATRKEQQIVRMVLDLPPTKAVSAK